MSALGESQDERDHAVRMAFYRSFLRCGGSISFSEWRALGAVDVAAFVEAAAVVEAERAAKIVEAFVLAQGSATRRAVLEEAARRALGEAA